MKLPCTDNRAEALVNASVGDLYFLHERGKRMALATLCLFGGAFLTPVIVGKMTSTMGWQWTHFFVAIFSAAMLPLLILFAPETAYNRDANRDTYTAIAASRTSGSTSHSQSANEKTAVDAASTSLPTPAAKVPLISYATGSCSYVRSLCSCTRLSFGQC
jgi:MFS family permease